MTDTPICPCEVPEHPKVISNPPNRDAIAYRAGDYLSFRDALLRAHDGEIELSAWSPGAEGDLAVQMMEWWAYLADILTFYDERIANESYLRTATLSPSVRRLVRLLGYRPRPGIGAAASLGALLQGLKPVSLDSAFQVQSKPGPGKQPQFFETTDPLTLTPPSAVAALPVTDGALFATDGSLLLAGAQTSIKSGDRFLVLEAFWGGANQHYAWVEVTSTAQEQDPFGKPTTRLQVTSLASGIPAGAQAQDYRLLRATQSAKPWPYSASTVIDTASADLDSLQRGIAAGQPVLFDIGQSVPHGKGHHHVSAHAKHAGKGTVTMSMNVTAPKPQLVSITGYGEAIWYANPKSSATPDTPPDAPAVPIAIPHSSLSFSPDLTGDWDMFRGNTVIRFAWQEAGTLIATPPTVFDGSVTTLQAVAQGQFPQGNGQFVLIEDAHGDGIACKVNVGTDRTQADLTFLPDTAFSLVLPVNVFCAPIAVTRGKTVAAEILGSGDATLANQSFTLKKSPLTYLPDPQSQSGRNYRSTLRVWVDGIEWREVPSFYGQGPDARIFVTSEDDNQVTTVSFGDGISGARLSSGSNNVTATYRTGSGAEAPAAGTLTLISKAMPGLRALRNPVPAAGGEDPDPRDQIRRYAPRSVLAFGRAVSGDDYEVIAAGASGVARARSVYGWDDEQQRAMVIVYVGDDSAAVDSARTALNGAADPNRIFAVKPATALKVTLSLLVIIASDRAPGPVQAALTAALTDPDTGLLGAKSVRIGASLYRSEINDACLDVAGTAAVHALTITVDRGSGPQTETGFRIDPGEGEFLALDPADLDLNVKVAEDAG